MNIRSTFTRGAIVLGLLLMPHTMIAQQKPEAAEVDFGRVLRGTPVEQELVIENNGDAAVHLTQARMTAPLVATALPGTIAPGAKGTLRFRLDTSRLQGLYEGMIALAESPTSEPASVLKVHGFIVPHLEFQPGPAVFLSASKGESKEQAVELVNHDATPVTITDVVAPAERVTARIETIEQGKRYRVVVRTRPDAARGRHADEIVLKTSSAATPRLVLQANTLVHDRVYTFPESIDLGALPIAQVRKSPDMLKTLAQRLMVSSTGAKDFVVKASTDIPGLDLSAQRAPAGDRWQITATLKPDQVRTGSIAGHITLETNDREYPTLTVPVSGSIIP
jgi:hypothetical protein